MSTETEGSLTRPAPTGIGGLLRNIGPGVVVSRTVVGSREPLVSTRMGGDVGFVVLRGGTRSEERRVGEEGRSLWAPEH